MSKSSWLAAQLGYDRDRVAELSPSRQRALAMAAVSAAPAVLLLSASAGYGAYLASDLFWFAVAVGLAMGFYLLNLLRIAVAGGGVSPNQPYAAVTQWVPRTVPLVMLGLLGVFFAQPLILALTKAEQDLRIDELRRALFAMHEEVVLRASAEARAAAELSLSSARERLEARARLLNAHARELSAAAGEEGGRLTFERAVADDRLAVEALREEVARGEAAVAAAVDREASVRSQDLEPYRRHLSRSHFLLRRVQLTWDEPLRPLGYSLAMVLLMVMPWLASATFARTASRAYEAGRWKFNRALIDAAHVAARREEATALSAFPTYQRPRLELYEDAPYDTKPRTGAAAFEARRG